MSGRGGLTAIKRLMNEYKGNGKISDDFFVLFIVLEISVNPPEGIFAGTFY